MIGNKLLELRKTKGLSQEEMANILGVSRQTVSKWETDQSTPDFDKIVPICNLFNITPNELILDIKEDSSVSTNDLENNELSDEEKKQRRAKGISLSVALYIISAAWLIVSIPVFKMNPVLSLGITLLIVAFATGNIIYTCNVYKKEKEEKKEHRVAKQINEVIAGIVCVIYFIISFTTMAWHLTWIIWIIYAVIEEIVKLIFMLKEEKENEEEHMD